MKTLLTQLPPPPPGKTGWPWTEETDPAGYDSKLQYPTISIVTPTFNQGQFIEETIRSILLQNYPRLEYMIIDGGSTDQTIEIIKKYEPWLSYWVSEKDRGQSHAINKGMERCSGDIFNWINSDDCLTKNALDIIVKGFSDPNILCYCGYALIEFEEDKTANLLFRTTLLDKDINEHLANNAFSQPSTFFRMTAFRSITPLEESFHMSMDMYMWYRFVCLYGLSRIAYTDATICIVKAHKDAKTIMSFEKSFADKQAVFNSLFVAIKKDFKPCGRVLPMEISKEVRKDMNYHLLRKRYCRTHPWQTDFNGKILKVNFRLIFEWFYLKLRTIGINKNEPRRPRAQSR